MRYSTSKGRRVPIYFALPAADTTSVSAAIEFLNTFLLQYVAFRRNEPSLCHASLTLHEIVEVALATDLDWIEKLVEDYNQHRFGSDDRDFVQILPECATKSSVKQPQTISHV